MRSRKWMWTSLLLALILGLSLGFLLDRLVSGQRESRDSGERSGRFMSRLESELDLTSGQKEQLEAVLAGNHERADAFWKQTRAAYTELRKEFRAQIRDVLTPEQQERFDAMMARADARREQRRKRED